MENFWVNERLEEAADTLCENWEGVDKSKLLGAITLRTNVDLPLDTPDNEVEYQMSLSADYESGDESDDW